MSTNAVSAKSIQRSWHLVDAKNQTLGRLAGSIANALMGKSKVNYVPYLDMGDYVVVTNVSKIKVSGRKAEQKKYYSHSGYPGGLRTQTYADLTKTNPQEIIKHAIKGMLPNNKLRSKMLKKLFIFADSNHPYKKQLKIETETVKETPAVEETN
jgi:large subunit ribosomal protein L13